ncbi:MAG TPA: SDR family oxidoreductase [Blastocatellia bacterium]|jgi:NAD(P)-dependent dehydrogenase (short-subunit alcohol dehydrogenase family)|nr:SDR family oxidoreductase [Blastocatellia bacterium]
MHTKRVAFITGANKGLGLEIARQLGRQGVTVALGARDKAKANEAADKLEGEGIDAHAVKLDVTNEVDIAALPDFFKSKFGRLDILVNNAGIALDFGGVTMDTFRQTYETNVFAPYFITQALLPLLKASPAGRIVNHSSIMGSMAAMGDSSSFPPEMIAPAYCSSKAALNMLTVTTARTLEGTNVKINAAHPGWVKTDMGSDRAPMEVVDGAKTAVALALLPDDGPTGGFFHLGEKLPW